MKHLIKLWKSLTLVGFVLTFPSSLGYGQSFSDEDLEQELRLSLPAEEREQILEDLKDLPEELVETLRNVAEEEDSMVLTVEEWFEIVIALHKDHARNPDRYELVDSRYPFSLRHPLLQKLRKAGFQPIKHPMIYEWAYGWTITNRNLRLAPVRARIQVVDEEGEALDGVTLEISRSYSLPSIEEMWGSEERSTSSERYRPTEMEIDGKTTIEMDELHLRSLRVTARKEGYYRARESIGRPTRKSVSYSSAEVWRDVVLGRETVIDPEEPKLLNVVLELRKKGEIVQLYSPFGELKAHADGSGTIANLRVPEEFRGDRSIREPQGFLKKVEDIKDYIEESKEPKDVFLLVDFEDGQFKDTVYLERGNQEFVYPRKIRLRMGDEEGGFILERAPRDARPMRSAYRLMTEAPEEGYQREIVVSVEDIHSMDDDGYLLFYFKADGHYGKGGFGPMHRMSVDHEGLEWISHSIGFHINPTPGDRNLETGR